MLDPKLQNYIVQSYPQIKNISSAEKITEGYLSYNHILNTPQEKYFLKQYREEYTEDRVKEVHKIINFFSDKGIPSVTPIENKQGKTYFIFNSHIYTLFPFLNGIVEDRKNITEKPIKSLAKTLAKIHLVSSNGLPLRISSHHGIIDRNVFLDAYPEIIKAIKSKKEKDDFDKLALKVLKLKKFIVDKSKKRTESSVAVNDHLLHGDYHEKNVFFDNDGEVKFIFDWEKTAIGNRLHELVRSMDFVCLDGHYEKENLEKARFYIQTYKELYPFDKVDFINSIEDYYLKNAHSLWIEQTHYLENSNRVDCFLENELALLKYYPKNYKRLIKDLGI
jgi:Ser/Thr protein kinase RdoA (MazF antagonist)